MDSENDLPTPRCCRTTLSGSVPSDAAKYDSTHPVHVPGSLQQIAYGFVQPIRGLDDLIDIDAFSRTLDGPLLKQADWTLRAADHILSTAYQQVKELYFNLVLKAGEVDPSVWRMEMPGCDSKRICEVGQPRLGEDPSTGSPHARDDAFVHTPAPVLTYVPPVDAVIAA